ncbi:MAG TPA: tetratricopeptide repeat protein [Polyangiaceae bacterium]|nr:tetratricopeptide repeat protein [Polyangiaceae bacterium]
MPTDPLRGSRAAPPRPRRALACLLAAGAALVASPRALRANPSAADVLFQEGRRLLKNGRVGEACELFSESQRLDPSSGTLLNLGDCRERQGRFASARAEFLSAARLAADRGDQEHRAEALRRVSALEPKLSHVIVRVAGAVPGLLVKLDHEVVDASPAGARQPADPGDHVVTAEAGGYAPFRASVRVAGPGSAVMVDVPALAPLASGAAPGPAAPVPAGGAGRGADAAPGRPTLGYALAGGGLAALGVSAVFGAMAIANYAKVDDLCSTSKGCPDRDKALDVLDRADAQAWVANAGLGLGLAGVAAGAYVLFVSPAKAGAARGAGTGVAIAPGGFTIVGRF